MKRDMKLVREMLLAIEASESGWAPDEYKIEGYTEDQINYHALLIMEAGLAHGENVSVMGGLPPQGFISRLSWEGHEFIDAARDESRWKQAMSRVGGAAGTVTMSVLKELLVQMLKDKLGLRN